MTRIPRSILVTLQWLLAAILLYFVVRSVAKDWPTTSEHLRSGHLGWGWILGSGLIFLATYGLLIETWRRVVAIWGEYLPWPAAARIWLVSNLGKYIPGKIWAITAMGAMAKQQGVSAVAAAGSAIVMQLVSITSGVLVIALTSLTALQEYRDAAIALTIILLAALLVGPRLGRRATRLVARLTGRSLGHIPDLPLSTILVASIGTGIAWVLYGVAFMMLTHGIIGDVPGPTTTYIAVYTGSYIVGLIILIFPGGIGPREFTLTAGLVNLLHFTRGDAGLIAIGSRVWLTFLEVIPGILYYFSRTGNPTKQPSTR